MKRFDTVSVIYVAVLDPAMTGELLDVVMPGSFVSTS